MAKIPEYLIGQEADELEQLGYDITYYKNSSKRQEASELIFKASELVRQADELTKSSDEEEDEDE